MRRLTSPNGELEGVHVEFSLPDATMTGCADVLVNDPAWSNLEILEGNRKQPRIGVEMRDYEPLKTRAALPHEVTDLSLPPLNTLP